MVEKSFVVAVTVVALFAVPCPRAADAEDSARPQSAERLVDRAGTLELDAELDARGNLGGLAIDRLGFLYAANFRDKLWRISPEGKVRLLTDALYGASGITVDARGRVYQSNFLGDSIVRIGRDGALTTIAAGEGLEGPVGLVSSAEQPGSLLVCNCRGNSLVRVTPEGTVEPFAKSHLFACPNGIARGPDERYYVTSFNSHVLAAVSPDAKVESFATVPGGAGNAHLAYSRGFFYVTKIHSHRVVKVSVSGEVFPLAGTGQPGHEDGPADQATFCAPNGIAIDPATARLYVSTMVGELGTPEPSHVTLRTIDLVTLSGVVRDAISGGGVDAAREAHQAYLEHPVRGKEDTSAEMVTLGYSYLSGRKIPQALAVFEMNAEAHPNDPNAHFHLGEACRYTGRIEQAEKQYRRVLELDPESDRARARLSLLEEN